MNLLAAALLSLVLPAQAGLSSQRPAQAEAAPATSQPSGPTVAELQRRVQALQENKELDETLKTKLIEIYTRAAGALRDAETASAQFLELKKKADEAPEKLKELKVDLGKSAADPSPQIPDDPTVAQLQQELTKAEADLAAKQKALADLEQEPRRRAERRTAIPKELTDLKAELEQIQKLLEEKPPADTPEELTTATRVLLDARKKFTEAKLRVLEQEPLSYDARAELIPLRRDQAARDVASQEKMVKAWQATVNQFRQAEAARQAREAERAAAEAHPAIKQLAKENKDLADTRTSLASKIASVTSELESLGKTLADIDAQFKKVTEREQKVGLTQVIGVLLRKQRGELPDLRRHGSNIDSRQSDSAHAHLELIEYEDQRSGLADVESQVQQTMESLGSTVRPEAIEPTLRQLLESKREFLNSLINDYGTYLERLAELDTRERELVSKTEEYLAYIDERILWVRSTSKLWDAAEVDSTDYRKAAVWLADPDHWVDLGWHVLADVRSNPLLFGLAAVVGIGLFATQRHRRIRLREIGDQAAKSYNTAMGPTLRAVGLTVLLACPWPALLAFVGWRLASSGSVFTTAWGMSIAAAALILLGLELVRQCSRPKGLGEAHFDWSPATARVMRSAVWRLIVLGLPMGLVIGTLEWQKDEDAQNSLGRCVFLASMIVLTVCLRQVLLPAGPVLQQVLAVNRGGWLNRLRYGWYPLAVGTPLLLAAAATVGYYYTALQLAWRLLMTLWLVLGLLLLTALTLRWLLLAQRALAIQQARERRAAQAEAREKGEEEGTSVVVQEPEIDLAAISTQSRKLVRVAVAVSLLAGIGFVWADVLPALGFLRRVELWPVRVVGTEGVETQWITLVDVGLAAAIALVTLAGAKNLPGLLEITILQRLPMQAGARFAITRVSRYLITMLGLVIAFGTIGIGWSKVQWLVAAMTVGLGFGLQEIFANFVSGLILLFERPIRVGDIVTVGDVTGKVSRIQIRATTVTDWDLRELVVPNKEFVTGRIINWTLSDTLSRMTITVGTAYGSDTELTRTLLLKVANEHPLVLKEPPSHALFDGFGDSTLNFTLRVYMASRDVYLQLRHELHVAIDKAFREAGIEIAFPQRDIHVRSMVEPLFGATPDGYGARVEHAGSGELRTG